MLIYIIIMILVFVLGWTLKPNINPKNKKMYIIIIFGVLTVVAAIRKYTVGIDTEQFCIGFMKAGVYGLKRSFQELRYEYGFIIFCRLLNFVNTNYQTLIIASSLFIFPLMGRFIYKNSRDVIMSTFLFISLNYYFSYMNIMRQAMAIAIILIGIDYLKEDKVIKFVISILIASLFHSSAIGMLIVIIFRHKEYNIRTYFYVLAITGISFVLAGSVFGFLTKIITKYASYENGKFYESNYFGALISSVVAFTIYTFCTFANPSKLKEKNVSFHMYLMSIFFMFNVLRIRISIMERISKYCAIYSIILLPEMIESLKNKRNRILYRIVVIFLTIIYWTVLAIYRPEWNGAIPYTTFFLDNINYIKYKIF